jgi:ubiquinone/menaquinone biosynthesis C-methylase UbiE
MMPGKPPRRVAGPDRSSKGEQLFQDIRNRFDSAEVARTYAQRKNAPTRRNLREWTCIEHALHGVPAGAHVLDLPCGTGRLGPLLAAKGFRVTAADYSEHMIEQATAAFLSRSGYEQLPEDIRFVRQDVMQTDFPDGAFDAVIFNRLLHHYPTPELRRRALRELSRVTKGVLVASYFSNFALSALKFHASNRLKGKTPTDRIPIFFGALKKDLDDVGLRCTGTFAVRYGLSPQTYLRLER